MANLETLFIEINGNADKAQTGINGLITSLSSLGTKVDEISGKFSNLRKQIQSVSRLGKIKLPSFSHITESGKEGKAPSATAAADAGKYSPGFTNLTQQMDTAGKVGTKAMNEVSSSTSGLKKVAQVAGAAFKKMGNSLSTVGRIAKTLLIRTALKAIMKAFSEAWTAAYNYSHAMGGQFAENVEKLRGAISGTAIKLVQAFAPALNAVVPVVNALAASIQWLCDWIMQLLNNLGVATEFFGTSAEEISKYGSSSSKAAKGMLASFDELNVIQSSSGGGGSGSGTTPMSFITNEITDGMAKIQMIAGASLLALGLILAFTGHVPIGVGLIAVGAASIAKTIVHDFGSLSDDMKNEIVKISAIAGGAMLALGVLLCCCGVLPLGIGLIVAGIGTFATTVAVTWNLLPEQTKKTLTTIGQYALGAGALGLGVFFLCTGNILFGLGLIGLAGYEIGKAAGVDWDAVVNKVQGVINAIADFFVKRWEDVKRIFNTIVSTVASVAQTVWSKVSEWAVKIWKTITDKVSAIGGAIAEFATNAWETIKEKADEIWKKASKLASDIQAKYFVIKGVLVGYWNSIKTAVLNAWDAVKTWIEAKWADFQQAWEDIKKGITDIWSTIKSYVSSAWTSVKDWCQLTWSRFTDWENIKKQFMDIWNNVKSAVSDAWTQVKTWISTTWDNTFVTAWDNIKKKMGEIWTGIGSGISDAWNNMTNWLNFKWSTISRGWEDVKEQFRSMWNSIGTFISNAWDSVSQWADSTAEGVVEKIKDAWKGVSGWFENNVTKPIQNAFNGAMRFVTNTINSVIKVLNKVGSFTIPAFKVSIPLTDITVGWDKQTVKLWKIATIDAYDVADAAAIGAAGMVTMNAEGAYGIPRGDLFIANEAGAELVGSMNGHTTVANQQQIIDGIASGVRDANAEQNVLLREQNALLRGILEKDSSFRASSAFGRTIKRSLDMYNTTVGV